MLLFGLLLCISCDGSRTMDRGASLGTPARGLKASSAPPPPSIHVVFRNGKVLAREGEREWPIAEVGRDEMLWAPDGYRFAYIKQQAPAQPASSQPVDDTAAPPRPKPPRTDKTDETDAQTYHIIIRNIRGDSVNSFPVYRPGQPTNLDWIDNTQVGYQAAPDKTGDVYVIHEVSTGEILQIFRGSRFIWSPGRKQLAYVTGPTHNHTVKVNDVVVWPRDTEPPKNRKRHRQPKTRREVVGELSWSPDGSGLAFMEIADKLAKLVVLLVVDNRDGDLSWPLPKAAMTPGNRLFWGESKVLIGQSVLKPRFAASWKRIY